MGIIPTLAINEIFGPTIQGEGPFVGYPTMFLRLAGCNLRCVWCDTRYAWDWSKHNVKEELHARGVDELYDQLRYLPIRHLVITGGEPMLQQRALATLTRALHLDGWLTELETAGHIEPESTELVRHFNISLKLRHSGNPLKRRYNEAAIKKLALAPSVAWKFVVESAADFSEIDELVEKHRLNPVYIMPQGIEEQRLKETLQEVAAYAIERGYRISHRLHIEIFGNRRGV